MKLQEVQFCFDSNVKGRTRIILSIASALLAAFPFSAFARSQPSAQSQNRKPVASREKPSDVHPGDLDASFGTNGKVTTDFSGKRDQGFTLVVQPDGKIVVAGSSINSTGNADFALARYNSDGSLDSTFGTGGKVTTDFGGNDQAAGVALQSDGKIVAVGGTCANSQLGCTSFTGSGYDFAIARYNSDGTLDTTFGTGGKVTTDFNGGLDLASSVLIQPDGRIVVGGTACPNSGAMCAFVGGLQFALARYNADGSLDTTFGTNGKVFTTVMEFGSILAVALQTDGKIIAAGLAFEVGRGDADFELVRYNTNGSVDATFGTNGFVNTDFNSIGQNGLYDAATALAIQPDGKIIAVGASETNTQGFFYNFSVARYNSNGSLDSSFGNGGKVSTKVSNSDNQAGSVILQPDGKLLVGGIADGAIYIGTDSVQVSDSGTSPGADFALVRYNSDGTIDSSFGTSGIVRTDFFGASDGGRFAIQPDGKVVGAGFARRSFTASSHVRPPRGLMSAAVTGWLLSVMDDQADADFALARYETGIMPTPDFSISIDPPSITTSKGTKPGFTINIIRTGGFTDKVTVTPPSTLPKKVKVVGAAVTTSGSSVAYKLKIKAAAASGTNLLTFTATDGKGNTRTATLSLTVQ